MMLRLRRRLLALFHLPVVASALFALSCTPTGAEPEHALYMAVSMTRDFTIGRETHRENGVFVSRDREQLEHIGFNHPRVDALAFDPRDPQVFYKAALNGVLGTRDGGDSWRILTGWRQTEGKNIAVNPFNPDQVYAALPDGVGFSPDQGASWSYRDDGIQRKYIQVLRFDTSREGHILAGTEKGIYRSEDGGLSWQNVLQTVQTVNDLRQSPHNPDHFIAATQADGAWLSKDAGQSWQAIEGIPTDNTLHQAAFDPHHPDRLAVCGWNSGLLISEDGGQSWTLRGQDLPNINIWSFSFDPDFPDRIYANPHHEALFVSDDFGRSWREFMFAGAVVWDYQFVRKDR